MIQLTKRLVMTADKHCYTVGEPRQRAGGTIEIKDPKYYTTAAQAVKGALATAMRMAVADNEVTTLRQFIQKQEQLLTELERLIVPLEGGRARQNVVEAHEATWKDKDTNETAEGTKPLDSHDVFEEGE